MKATARADRDSGRPARSRIPRHSEPGFRDDNQKETPLCPPVNGGIPKKKALSTARRKDDQTLRRVIGELLLDHTETAEAILRELNAVRGQLAKHSHGMQIARVEIYFKEMTGKEPWPKDIPNGMLMHFRGKIGMVLKRVKLARLLDDIKAAGEVKNLIYFLSTESGKKSSRWEMLMVEAREQELARNKALERAEMEVAWERIFGKDEVPDNRGAISGMTVKKAEPGWVFGLKAERDNLTKINKIEGMSGRNYRDNLERIKNINRRLQHWEKTGK